MVKKITFVFVLICFGIIFTACGPKPDETVKGFLEAAKKGEINSMSNYVKKEGNKETFKYDDKEQEQIVKSTFAKLSYEIVSSKVDGKNAVVKTKITSPDLPAIYGKVVTNMMPALLGGALDTKSKDAQNQLMQAFVNAINAPDAPKTTTEVDVKLVKGDKGWLMDKTEDLLNAMTGNLVKAFEKGKNTSSKPDPKIYGVNEEAKIGRAAFTVTKFELSEGSEYDKPKEGYIFAVATVKKKNISKDTLKHSENDFKIETNKKQIIDASIHSIGKRYGEGKLAGGGENDGNIIFEVPKDSEGLILLYYPEEEALLKFKLK